MENKLPEHIHDKIKAKAEEYESATQHDGLGPAIFKDGVFYAMAYAKVEADKALQQEHQQLKERCDKMEAALKDIAQQQKSSEWEEEGDTEHGYDCIIDVAREAIAREDVKLTPEQIASRKEAIEWYRNPEEEKEGNGE